MMKFPFKVITLATLATVITATNGSTIHALAQEQTAGVPPAFRKKTTLRKIDIKKLILYPCIELAFLMF
ncbi:hypothetical protein [Bacillus thuringiensis]|uniref:hypothetical protein n=1 Tax=Bacillus thuringiensis TaxID=1428 RepID=UPI0026E41E6A|nr:hypothetical protein [Bacillus thuringiensis]MDO6632244.1 hypothetical protein [Bacillus thuringiensis]MDO6661747.1 hypothetical protein [Bacillus thuringiensis]MDO6702493.1 hypothetical protein [Bacillus thuringiensis]